MLALAVNQQTAWAMCRQISEDGLHVGMINTPNQTVVCGRFDDLDLLQSHVERKGIPCRRLAALLPIHTPLFKPAALQAILRQEERTVRPVLPPLYFTTECRPIIESDTVRNASLAIWTKPANLVESVEDLQENFGINHFIEINTTPTLTPMIIKNAHPGTRVDGPPPGITDAADVLPFLNGAGLAPLSEQGAYARRQAGGGRLPADVRQQRLAECRRCASRTNVLAASQRDRALQAGLGYRERGYARPAWQDH